MKHVESQFVLAAESSCVLAEQEAARVSRLTGRLLVWCFQSQL